MTSQVRVAILTISDRGYSGEREDKSGPALVERLKDEAFVSNVDIVPDEADMIRSALVDWCDSGEYDVILTTGGTGFGPRDLTPEATLAVIERHTPGISEAIRQASLQITPRAMLSRAVSGIRGKTFILNLPGSPKAAVECLEVFLLVMAHAVETLRGDTSEYANDSSHQ